MKNRTIYYKGYFLLALTFVFASAVIGLWNQIEPMPVFTVGIVLLVIGCIKTAIRNASLTDNNS